MPPECIANCPAQIYYRLSVEKHAQTAKELLGEIHEQDAERQALLQDDRLFDPDPASREMAEAIFAAEDELIEGTGQIVHLHIRTAAQTRALGESVLANCQLGPGRRWGADVCRSQDVHGREFTSRMLKRAIRSEELEDPQTD